MADSDAPPAFRRVLLKLSGEALAGAPGLWHRSGDLSRIADGDLRGRRPSGPGGRRDRRRQHLPRHRGERRRDGPRHRRLHGHAGHRHQCAGPPGRHREGRRADPRAVGDRDARGGRALHPPARDPPPGKGARGRVRRRHRQPVLHDGHGGGAARGGDRRRGHPEGDQGGRHLHGRSRARIRTRSSCRASGTSRCSTAGSR